MDNQVIHVKSIIENTISLNHNNYNNSNRETYSYEETSVENYKIINIQFVPRITVESMAVFHMII